MNSYTNATKDSQLTFIGFTLNHVFDWFSVVILIVPEPFDIRDSDVVGL